MGRLVHTYRHTRWAIPLSQLSASKTKANMNKLLSDAIQGRVELSLRDVGGSRRVTVLLGEPGQRNKISDASSSIGRQELTQFYLKASKI